MCISAIRNPMKDSMLPSVHPHHRALSVRMFSTASIAHEARRFSLYLLCRTASTSHRVNLAKRKLRMRLHDAYPLGDLSRSLTGTYCDDPPRDSFSESRLRAVKAAAAPATISTTTMLSVWTFINNT